MSEEKPLVHYSGLWGKPAVGARLIVAPLDHPGPGVSNKKLALTSPVVAVGEAGEFETENSRYAPAPTH